MEFTHKSIHATHSNPQSGLLHLFMTCFSPQIHSPKISTHLRRSQSSCSLSVSHYTHTTVTKMLWGAFPTHDMHTNQWKLLHITSHWQEINSKHTLIPCTFPLPTSWAGCDECLCCWLHQRHPPTAQQWINGVHPHLLSEAWHKICSKKNRLLPGGMRKELHTFRMMQYTVHALCKRHVFQISI
jgi:hypothetical protein